MPTTYILDPFQRLLPHTTSTFKVKIQGKGSTTAIYTATSSTNYTSTATVVGATIPLNFNLKILEGSVLGNTYQDYADPSLPGRNIFYWNVHPSILTSSTSYYIAPEPITALVQPTYSGPYEEWFEPQTWEDMLGTLYDPYIPLYTDAVYFYYAKFFFDDIPIAGTVGEIKIPIEYSVWGTSLTPSPATNANGGGRYTGSGYTYPIILQESYHNIRVELWQDYFPGRITRYTNYGTPSQITYPAIPEREEKLLGTTSQIIKFTGTRNLISTHNTGTVSSNTGSSTATSIELLYIVNNKTMSESIDVYASFSTGTSWANIWDLPNIYRSKSTSTGNLLISADLQFNGQSIRTVLNQWPISSTGSKLVGKLYNNQDRNSSANSVSGILYAQTGTYTTSGAQFVSFNKNNTNTVSISLTFTGTTGTVYTTSSSITARWV